MTSFAFIGSCKLIKNMSMLWCRNPADREPQETVNILAPDVEEEPENTTVQDDQQKAQSDLSLQPSAIKQVVLDLDAELCAKWILSCDCECLEPQQ